SYTLAEIEILLNSNNKSLEDFPELPKPDMRLVPEIRNRLIYDELNYDRQFLENEHRKLMSTMTTEQRKLRSKGEIVLMVESSGIAALLIPGGRTAH
ncbi:helicase-like protein, partial [Trifolium pratense]